MNHVDEPLISAKKLAELLHAHAHALLLAHPKLTSEAALAQVSDLAVTVYDAVTLAAALRKAAADRELPDTLARIVLPGGSTSALT